MSTPGGVELHQPHRIPLQHRLVKVVVGELDHVLLTAAAAATAALEGSGGLLNTVHAGV